MNALTVKNTVSADLTAQFFDYIDATPRTVETYAKAIRQFLQWLQAEGITQPTRADLLRWRDELKLHHKPATVQLYIVAVRQLLKWSAQEGFYPNVADHIKGGKIDKTSFKKDPLTSHQVQNILATIDRGTAQGLRDYAILALAVTTGLRTIELQRANIEDLRTVGDSPVLFIQGKGREEKAEYAKLSEPVERAIRAYLAARGQAAAIDPLFASCSDRNTGDRLTTKSISRLIKTAFKKAGYDSDRLTAHSLRHTAATLNRLNGGTLEETQGLLRHRSADTTAIYDHFLNRAGNQSEYRVSQAIFGRS